ncbi:sodium-dependent transporter [Desulfovermiculus halophilus]|uniref:sodium-dependent transporter n=1 Tax=Desulfovermiculus halophilus TaxID=339722 RepID=UPI00048312D4|nr:sodium-dependent transporter [Desulfovermiculus halophilus]
MAQREQWGTRAGFIMAAVGSAIGLGNIWRFPYMAYDNGGGAFLIPYFFALLTAGIPIIIMEFGLGHKFKGSAPMSFAKAKKKWEWLGWWQVFVSFIISIYYAAVIAWALNYALLATNLGWGEDTQDFFFNQFLQLSSSPMEWGNIVWPIFVAGVLVWFITWLALFSGVKKGIEFANKIFMPVLFVLLLIMLGRAVTLEGASEGLQWLFRPDFSAILDYQVWTAAYGQIFFTLSICFAIMITYSSYLPDESDINNNGMMTAFINCGFSLLAGIMIFAVLGYMATQQGVGVQDVAGAGVGLAFITIPKAISLLPGASFFGILFFVALVFAGLSSMISITEACCSGLMDKFGWGRRPTTSLFCIIGFMLSLVFMTQGGLLVLDIVDHFINNFGIVFAGLVEVILLSWFFRLDSIREHANSMSDFHIGTGWNFCLKVITPIVLGYMAIANLVGDIRTAYGGYPGSALLIFGWVIVVGIVGLSFVMQSGRSCAADE